jgi:beta-lactamase class D
VDEAALSKIRVESVARVRFIRVLGSVAAWQSRPGSITSIPKPPSKPFPDRRDRSTDNGIALSPNIRYKRLHCFFFLKFTVILHGTPGCLPVVHRRSSVTAQNQARVISGRKNVGKFLSIPLVVCWILLLTNNAIGQTRSVQVALHSALSGTRAVAVVLDGSDGHLLATEHMEEMDGATSAPGSTLKPLFLMAALEKGLIRENSTVVCRRHLRIAGRNLDCTHPLDQSVFTAETALAYSCNSYFASVATRFTPQQAAAVLREDGFGTRSGLLPGEASGLVRNPASEQELQLLVLGLEGVAVTPVQLARAYVILSHQLPRELAVRRGLEGSVAYGMAHNAATPGLAISGKTGTASDPGQSWTHGWFAGIASRNKEKIVIVIYVPRGNGADAAQLAHRFFSRWQRTAP